MTVGVGEIALSLIRWCSIGLPSQTSPLHRRRRQRVQIRGLHSSGLGNLHRLVSGRLNNGFCHLGLLSSWCFEFAGGCRSGPGLRAYSCRCRAVAAAVSTYHLLAGLTEERQIILMTKQFIRQIKTQLPHAATLVFLGIQDFGPAHQGVDLLLQLLLNPEHSLVAHGLILRSI
jgi:hypothetical protein